MNNLYEYNKVLEYQLKDLLSESHPPGVLTVPESILSFGSEHPCVGFMGE